MKKFVNKKVMDWKFKKAGEGHSLSEEKGQPSQPASKPDARVVPSPSSESAGSAALARFQTQDKRGQPSSSRPGRGGRARGGDPGAGGSSEGPRKKPCSQPSLEREDPVPVEPEVVDVASSAVTVHVICPLCQLSIPNSESLSHLTVCLHKESELEPVTGAVKMIHSLCQDQERRRLCVDTLAKYLTNISTHPGEEKYHRIRVNNKVFQERVVGVDGALLFLKAVGFQDQVLPHQDTEEAFLVLPAEKAEAISDLETYRVLLSSGEKLCFKLDRNPQVFQPSFHATKFSLHDSFFNVTVEEIRKEQKMRSEMLERDGVLRTKVMRERDEVKMATRHYRFVLIRVRMPDGYILQGVFRPLEKLGDVREFVASTLADQSHVFSLSCVGKPLLDENMSLAAFGLVPSAVLNFAWDTSFGPAPNPPYLNLDLLARVQDIS